MISPYKKPLIPASVMLGDRDLSAGQFADGPDERSPSLEAAPVRCQLYSRRCLKKVQAKRVRRLMTA